MSGRKPSWEQKSGRPKREHASTSAFSSYRRFWRGCKWELYFQPTKTGGFEGAKSQGLPGIVNEKLKERPGVYEFAIALKSKPDKRIKVYVGESGNVRLRQMQYGNDGDHLRPYIDAALKDDYLIFRRLKYLKTKEKAEAVELEMLQRYDYAWNRKDNGSKRLLKLKQDYTCCCFASGVIIMERPPIKEKPLKPQQLQPSPSKGVVGAMKGLFGSSRKMGSTPIHSTTYQWARS